MSKQTSRRRRRSPKTLASTIASAFLNSYDVHDIVERQSAEFDKLVATLREAQGNRLKGMVALEDKIKSALPTALHGDFITLLDANSADLCAYLEAGYLIGLAMSRKDGAS